MPRLPDTIWVAMGKEARKEVRVKDIAECRDNGRGGIGCGAQIYWCETGRTNKTTGKPVLMPVNVATIEDARYEGALHEPHHATCPNAESFRPKKRR